MQVNKVLEVHAMLECLMWLIGVASEVKHNSVRLTLLSNKIHLEKKSTNNETKFQELIVPIRNKCFGCSRCLYT